ncbi:hypothetical protein SYNTR_1801 [Candidatus Syntrophocurvum alkaliphilum]|uniref:Uncharacterized protein n=1 Tax=Candidatus Syntrophocurvum alkaliphilum TaxID=2293317 RepID=A0A6I6DCK8_9FIRM|nr:hypothetical protein SYNTR_1801 [Candidatus Syntrophocurvum alkaliphilum]
MGAKSNQQIKDMVNKCIENFRNQQNLYAKMLYYAKMQLEQTEATDVKEVEALLLKRTECLDEIIVLNQHNKILQDEIVDELNMSSFILSQLHEKLDSNQYEELKNIIAQTGDILREISIVDKENEKFIRSGLGTGASNAPKASNKQAKSAYNKSMNQNKEKN